MFAVRAPEIREAKPSPPPASVARRFLPGSEWLYLKVYTGSTTADAVLRTYLAPVIATAMRQGLARRWFFLRYGDPDWHLRVRFHGDPATLTALGVGEVALTNCLGLPCLARLRAKLLDSWRNRRR